MKLLVRLMVKFCVFVLLFDSGLSVSFSLL